MDGGKKKKDEPKWNHVELKVGNIFSGVSYFQAQSTAGDLIQTKCDGKDVTVSRDILECQMHNASVFANEEKVTMTRAAELLQEAHTACFTICFSTKVDEKAVKEKLQELTEAQLKDKAELKKLVKELLTGKETTIVGRLSKAMGKLGRSLIIDLPTHGYRNVDHRTIKWMIIKNTKYTVGK